MKTKLFLTLVFVLSLPFLSLAQEGTGLIVDDIQICTSITDRQPAGADSNFSKDVGRLYCFTKLSGGQGASLSHVWYYKDKEALKVELTSKAKTWRTWSEKKILPAGTGEWRVDVQSSDGKVVATKSFTVRE